MKYKEYIERKEHETSDFLIGYDHVTPQHALYNMPYHWHTHYEIIRIISGSFHLAINNKMHTFYPGDIVFITSGVVHGGTPMDCVYDCIVFNINLLIQKNLIDIDMIKDLVNNKILVDICISKNNKIVAPIVDELCSTLAGKRQGYEVTAQGYVYLLLGAIFRERLYSDNNERFRENDYLKSIKDVFSYISENYANNINLNDIAKVAGMNPKYFCRYFKNITERTPIDYVNYFRIEKACELLTKRDVTVQEAAISCGFNDESYFIRTFKKYKNMTPKAFMNMETMID